VHVNADDAEGCIAAIRLAIAYRETFGKDFLIDLVGYRRHGHNEGDEPTYTQPSLYAAIRAHPTSRQIWAERMIREGVVTAEEVEAMDREVMDQLDAIHDGARGASEDDSEPEAPHAASAPSDVAVSADRLIALNEHLLEWPAGFSVHPRLARQIERRRDALGDQPGIDWGHAEALAFASLLSDGISVRMSGQDTSAVRFRIATPFSTT
jgi:2-oxoglutarate dehydrogenase E1 component